MCICIPSFINLVAIAWEKWAIIIQDDTIMYIWFAPSSSAPSPLNVVKLRIHDNHVEAHLHTKSDYSNYNTTEVIVNSITFKSIIVGFSTLTPGDIMPLEIGMTTFHIPLFSGLLIL